MRRGPWTPDPTTVRATTPGDVIHARQLISMDVPERTIYHRCLPGGPWRRLLPGVIMLHNGPPTERQLIAAALIYGGSDSLVTGLRACRWHGVRRGPAPTGRAVHLLVPARRQLRAFEYVTIERTTRVPDPVVRDGVPLAPVARACIDAARRLSDPGDVTELLADAVQRGLCDVAGLHKELAAGSRRGTAVPRAVLAQVDGGARSAAERDAQRLWPSTGLPTPIWNASIYDGQGRLLGVADGWCDEVALAWEIDSVEFHLSPADYARTTERAARMAAEGVLVVPTLPSRLRRDRAGVVAELRSAYRSAANRPRPPLRAVASPR